MNDKSKINIRNQNLEQLQHFVAALGQPGYRALQIYDWLWKKGVQNLQECNNIPKIMREHFESNFYVDGIAEDTVQVSLDGTIKTRFRLIDHSLIESVLIPVPEDGRFTVCVSSQVGCSLSCKFCATGMMERVRNLTPGEIFDQVFKVNIQCLAFYGKPITNIVFMGMGEPLLNYKNVMTAIHHITGKHGLHMSPSRITISTAGIAKMISKLADDQSKVNLALSLHAADDDKRNEIMPINETNNLEALMAALSYFYKKTKGKISYEYIAFENFNDSPQDASKLARLCQSFPVKVNIIEYNPVEGVHFVKSEENTIDRFARSLRDKNIMVTVRRSRGKDIDAACGQLANK
ncbi:MAG TPA: 23S rRNA (adenine(2503)-C(2))-methyltransferase RlmN [Saprospiraceae bacterium]|nr:23S rRNA (adenine(2503)-C(2))-methyltransferase RlmN [Saprospiraceae bacterium]